MGLARVGGMCTNAHNCVIGELGVTNSMGKPYPSAGFTAVFVMAREIGHNLGMFHDNTVSFICVSIICNNPIIGWLCQRWFYYVPIKRVKRRIPVV